MKIDIADFTVSNDDPLFLIGGPCALESEEIALKVGRKLKEITDELNIGYVFKSSFDKANRSSVESYRGPGLEKGLEILDNVRSELDVPVLTDIHTPEQAQPVSKVVDVIQIPAFLCRQTDLIVEAARTGVPLNIKKGQFLSAEGMGNVVEKARSKGNEDVMLCERGAMFGYNNLVADMRNLEVMKQTGLPVVFDATHSVQRPGARGDSTGGNREFAFPLARAATAVGVAGLFMEAHPNPESAKSDSATQMPLEEAKKTLRTVKAIDEQIKN
ncbi:MULTISPECIES: 3-deoxy-8-phosphooctulonate synthase [unclassified Haloferax]|uniref:3-deoxy-8-phosphooctulonate synthase n=1 Tax=unclassified Haloferax TaxID=2625095 RepID=UPI0028744646|nr:MULTISPECIES: 3-deoxy-8-phosphooctulonate synthase [unclassified Haloferax]MDS0239879.1 3-deoxy-8-phosphooctulonate synthase [Haloferax sp. S2CR25]MDS0443000.1 3-deoxy-8-phosphooctulonate synthase [Haloferax sp. S2CR25-2]